MRQAKKYWITRNNRTWYLFAQDETGEHFKVTTRMKEAETQMQIEHRLITRMHKKHGLATFF